MRLYLFLSLFFTVLFSFLAADKAHCQTDSKSSFDMYLEGNALLHQGGDIQKVAELRDKAQTEIPSFFLRQVFPGFLKDVQAGKGNYLDLLKEYEDTSYVSHKLLEPLFFWRDFKSVSKLDGKEYAARYFTRLKEGHFHSYIAGFLGADIYCAQKEDFTIEERLELIGVLKREAEILDSLAGSSYSSVLFLYLNLLLNAETFAISGSDQDFNEVMKYIPDFSQANEILKFVGDEGWGVKSLPEPDELLKPLLDESLRDSVTNRNLTYGVRFAAAYPLSNYYEKLRKAYELSDITGTFTEFWVETLTENWESLNEVETVKSYIDTQKEPHQWMLIDVWGTWCAPCIQKLPVMIEVDQELAGLDNTPVKFVTLSSGSKNLTEFMEKNNYDFPVLEVEEETTKALNISSYPTVFLVSPDGRYSTIPFGLNKKEILNVIKLYAGIEE